MTFQITEAEWDETLQRIALLEHKLANLTAVPAAQVQNTSRAIPRGKYIGRLHADIVREDPHHVRWLGDNGHARGLGYTEAQVEEARKLAAGRPDPRATAGRERLKPVPTRHLVSPAANTPPQEDMDDDIPF